MHNKLKKNYFFVTLFFFAFFYSCSDQDSEQIQKLERNQVISSFDQVSSYKLQHQFIDLTISRDGEDILVQRRSLENEETTIERFSSGDSSFEDLNSFLNGKFEFRTELEAFPPTYSGFIITQEIFDEDHNQLGITDADKKKFKLYEGLGNTMLIAVLYVNGQQPLELELIKKWLVID